MWTSHIHEFCYSSQWTSDSPARTGMATTSSMGWPDVTPVTGSTMRTNLVVEWTRRKGIDGGQAPPALCGGTYCSPLPWPPPPPPALLDASMALPRRTHYRASSSCGPSRARWAAPPPPSLNPSRTRTPPAAAPLCWKYALEAIIKGLLYFLVHDNCLLFML